MVAFDATSPQWINSMILQHDYKIASSGYVEHMNYTFYNILGLIRLLLTNPLHVQIYCRFHIVFGRINQINEGHTAVLYA